MYHISQDGLNYVLSPNNLHISLLATTKVHFSFTKISAMEPFNSLGRQQGPLNGNPLYRWKVKARENGDVLDM